VKLTSKAVGLHVQRALCLEALADKFGCTSRYADLPGRPLEDFIIAGINVGPIFEEFATDWLSGNETRLFHRFIDALQASNHHKSDKFVNFGLLEILFPAVAARIVTDDWRQAAPKMIELIKQAPKSDVAAMVAACALAWSTSEKRDAKMADLTPAVRSAPNPYDFYLEMIKGKPHGSAREWVENYEQGLPLLCDQLAIMQEHPDVPILNRVKEAYEPVRAANPDIRIGILADMSAAAIFLHLSYATK
jgi:hypothetical protein